LITTTNETANLKTSNQYNVHLQNTVNVVYNGQLQKWPLFGASAS